MQVAARTAAWAGRHVPLEYIEANGDQYIDSLIKGRLGLSSSWDIAWNTNETDAKFHGSRTSSNSSAYLIGCYARSRGDILFNFDNATSIAVSHIESSTVGRFVVVVDGSTGSASVNGEIASMLDSPPTEFETENNIIIFGRYNNGTLEKSFGKVYGIYFYDQVGAVSSMTPVLKSGVPCLFDSVRGVYLYNSGTGTFGYKKLDGTIVAPGGGYKLICSARRCTRSWRPSARFRARWEVAA